MMSSVERSTATKGSLMRRRLKRSGNRWRPVVMRLLASIKPNPLNNPERTELGCDAMRASLRTVGFLQPIVLAKDGETIMMGHRRYLAAKRESFTRVPCIVSDLDQVADWACVDDSTITRQYIGRDYLYAVIVNSKARQGVPRRTRTLIERLEQMLGSTAEVDRVVFKNGQGPSVVNQAREFYEKCDSTDVAPGDRPTEAQFLEWLCSNHQTMALRKAMTEMLYMHGRTKKKAMRQLIAKILKDVPIAPNPRRAAELRKAEKERRIGAVEYCKVYHPKLALRLLALESEFAAKGKTRRNWWAVLAGGKNGKPSKVYGVELPVLAAAQERQGLPVTPNAV